MFCAKMQHQSSIDILLYKSSIWLISYYSKECLFVIFFFNELPKCIRKPANASIKVFFKEGGRYVTCVATLLRIVKRPVELGNEIPALKQSYVCHYYFLYRLKK